MPKWPFKVETVVTNLEVPWSIVWAPDGRMFFTERPGRVRVYENGKLASRILSSRCLTLSKQAKAA